MNLDIFKPNDEDGAFLAYIKREALSHISTINIEYNKIYWYDYYKALIELIKASINNPYENSYNFIDNIIHYKDYYKYEIPISTINISEDDFRVSKINGFGYHKRCACITWNTHYNLNEEKVLKYAKAFIIQERKEFDFINKKVNEKDYIQIQQPIFISKGGIINGDYIESTYFRKKDYNDGRLLVKLPIKIPVANVIFNDKNNETEYIYVVDHREPALKELMETYNCEIENNEEIASYKLNLRTCKAESKARKDYTLITFDKPEICKRGNYEVVEKDGAVYLNCLLGTIAKWKDGHLTIYWNKCRYKKINSSYWEWFTKHNLQHLKTIYRNNNNNITFVY